MALTVLRESIKQVLERINRHLTPTPLIFAEQLSSELGCNVWLKLESEQLTGSFKIRGALNKATIMTDSTKPLVTASSGNHGSACCKAWQMLGLRGVIFVPHSITSFKEAALSKYSDLVEIRKCGTETCQAEVSAREYANENGLVYVSPYNDADIIAGQGTCGIEVLTQLPEMDAIFVPVGGGGLISGIAGAIKSNSSNVSVIGCQPTNDAVMYKSVQAGHIISYEEAGCMDTISQSTSGGVESGSLTLEYCRDLVDDWFLLSELEIAQGVLMIEKFCKGMMTDPGSGLVMAALYKQRKNWIAKNVVLVISSGNIGEDEIKFVRELCAKSNTKLT